MIAETGEKQPTVYFECAGIGQVSTLTCTSSGVYIANLPGKRLVIVGPSG